MSDLPDLPDEAFRAIIDDAPDGILLVDASGRILFANKQVSALFGFEIEEIRGQRVEVLMPASKRPMHVIHREIYQDQPETRPMGTGLDLSGQRRNGSTFPVEISLSHLGPEASNVVVAVIRDVTRQRRAEEALRRSEERHRLLAEQAQDVIFRYRLLPTPGFEYVSAAINTLLGYQPEEFYVDDGLIFRVVHPDDREVLELGFSGVGPPTFTLRFLHRDGTPRWFEQGVRPVANADGAVVALEGIARDVTERRAADEDRQRLLAEVERQVERAQIAGDLHDDTIQSIYALGLSLHTVKDDPAVTKEAALTQAIDGLNQVIRDLRAYMQRLSGEEQPQTDVARLDVRIAALIPRRGATDWDVQVEAGLAGDPELDRHLYLIAKELISNVERHARARVASVRVGNSPDAPGQVQVTVSDDGVGFDRSEVHPEGYGLRSLEQRVVSLGGTLSVQSALRGGTTVLVRLPLHRA